MKEYLILWRYRDRRIASGPRQISAVCAKSDPEAQRMLHDGIAEEFGVDRSEVVIDEVWVAHGVFHFGKSYVPAGIAEP